MFATSLLVKYSVHTLAYAHTYIQVGLDGVYEAENALAMRRQINSSRRGMLLKVEDAI